MYAALWRRLPGPTPVRVLLALLAVVLVVVVLFGWVFPVLAPLVPFNNGTVTQQ